MTLPKILTPHRTVEVDGVEFDIRALTRAEAAKFQKMVAGGSTMGDIEQAVIAAATDTPADEVKEWYATTPSPVVEELMVAIRDLSAIGDEGAQKSG